MRCISTCVFLYVFLCDGRLEKMVDLFNDSTYMRIGCWNINKKSIFDIHQFTTL